LNKEISKQLELEKINKNIQELRDILNEICCTVVEDEKDKERLEVSEALDKLIVQYMKELNK
jgi:two-component system, cell cycle response regulator